MAMLGLTGVTAIELKVASVTVNTEVADRVSKVTVMSDEPTAMPLARPLAFTVATSISADNQLAEAVISAEIPSE